MATQFPTKIVELRKEKGYSQKSVAEDLGISQALLSHYEKGIRECGLSFLTKIANYYSVTTDYLLGLSNSRDVTDISKMDVKEQWPDDDKICSGTFLHSQLYLNEMVEKYSPDQVDNLKSLNSLFLYRSYIKMAGDGGIPIKWLKDEDILTNKYKRNALDGLINAYLESTCENIGKARNRDIPCFVNTIMDEGSKLLRNEMLKEFSIEKDKTEF